MTHKPKFKAVPYPKTDKWCVCKTLDERGNLRVIETTDTQEQAEALSDACNHTKIRALTAAEVTFTVRVESEDTDPRGNYLASGDDEADRLEENELIERLNNGDELAWFCLAVEAEWNGIKGFDYLGACSVNTRTEVDETVDAHDMRGNALDDLNAQVLALAAKLYPLKDSDNV